MRFSTGVQCVSAKFCSLLMIIFVWAGAVASAQTAPPVLVEGPVQPIRSVLFPPSDLGDLFTGSVVWSYNKQVPTSEAGTLPRIRVHLADIRVVSDGDFVVEVAGRLGEVIDRLDSTFLSKHKQIWSKTVFGDLISVRVRGRDAARLLSFRVDLLSFSFKLFAPKSIIGPVNGLQDIATYIGPHGELVKAAAPSVAKISFIHNASLACTGFLVGPDLLMTNNHCIDRAELCDSLEAIFGYEKLASGGFHTGKSYRCAAFIDASPKLDAALVRLEKPPGNDDPRRKSLGFSDTEVSADQPLIMIQHPGGQAKKVSVEGCKVESVFAASTDFKHGCDSIRGSSGSPIVSLAGTVVGLHKLGHESEATTGVFNVAVLGREVASWLEKEKEHMNREKQESDTSASETSAREPSKSSRDSASTLEEFRDAQPLPLPSVTEEEAMKGVRKDDQGRTPSVSSPGSEGSGTTLNEK